MACIFAQRLALERAARLYFGFCDFFDGNGFLYELSTYDVYFGKRYSVQKVPKNPREVGLSIFRAGGKKCLAVRGCTAQLTAWQGVPCHLEWSADSERVNLLSELRSSPTLQTKHLHCMDMKKIALRGHVVKHHTERSHSPCPTITPWTGSKSQGALAGFYSPGV